MKNNELKEKRAALLAEEIIADPDILRGKKLTWILLLIWLATRLLFLIAEIISSNFGFFEFKALNILSCVIALLFALLLKKGVKNLPILFLLGGVYMVIDGFRNGYYPLLGLPLYPWLWLYYAMFLLSGWAQTLVMLALLFLPSCAKFAAAGSRIDKALKGETEPAGPHL